MKENILLELLNRKVIASGLTGYYYNTENLFTAKCTLLDLGAKYYWSTFDLGVPSFKGIHSPDMILTGTPCWKPLIP